VRLSVCETRLLALFQSMDLRNVRNVSVCRKQTYETICCYPVKQILIDCFNPRRLSNRFQPTWSD